MTESNDPAFVTLLRQRLHHGSHDLVADLITERFEKIEAQLRDLQQALEAAKTRSAT